MQQRWAKPFFNNPFYNKSVGLLKGKRALQSADVFGPVSSHQAEWTADDPLWQSCPFRWTLRSVSNLSVSLLFMGRDAVYYFLMKWRIDFGQM